MVCVGDRHVGSANSLVMTMLHALLKCGRGQPLRARAHDLELVAPPGYLDIPAS